ncbi:MAG: transcription antitermination factor NusB [Thiovulaceae bacterium]|nr:transcription antitermination factor NusB [Sulfurimonadaceae bacterium]
MATRHQAREAVISLLYAYDMGNEEIAKHADDILEDKKIRNKQKDFALELFEGTMGQLESLDKVIIENLKEWDFERLGNIERAILRLGSYEVLNKDLDSAVIINEAIELAKKLCSEQSPSFINGVLDGVSKTKATK